MMLSFRKDKKPKEYIISINENLQIVASDSKSDKDKKKAVDTIAANLNSIKEMLVDKSDTRLTGKDKDADLTTSERERINEIIQEIALEILKENGLPMWIENLDALGFESSKQIVELCGHVFRKQIGNFNSATQFILTKQSILLTLLDGYKKPDRAIHYGSILREAIKHEEVAKVLLYSPKFYDLFDYVQGTAFDVSSDAFSTFRDLLGRHKEMVAEFLVANYDPFFSHYRTLIESNNYVTVRQALKLLAELLLDRHNFQIQKTYISEAENLKLIMNLLVSKKKQIAFEAFHVFKSFLANMNKPDDIQAILYSNRSQLIEFLGSFQTDRTDDGQLNSEKMYLIKIAKELQAPVAKSKEGMVNQPPVFPPPSYILHGPMPHPNHSVRGMSQPFVLLNEHLRYFQSQYTQLLIQNQHKTHTDVDLLYPMCTFPPSLILLMMA
ncbi:Calcium-binding protein 39 [Cichlidogyrus casuarinus]|uniref:Calcium-binding protein 39 n=1 Tax=Cichlidogyrus casuarinus TaxID=1844966 RepID=A0ABD2QI22_9PLAT